MQDFKKLQVWQKAHQVVLDTYKVTQIFPQTEQCGLTNQLRRAAESPLWKDVGAIPPRDWHAFSKPKSNVSLPLSSVN